MPDPEFKDALAGVRPGGCVDRFIPDFVAGLVEDGYSLSSARDYGRSAAHFGRWLDSFRLGRQKTTDATIVKFAHHRCKCFGIGGRGRSPSRRYVMRVRRFVDYLRYKEGFPYSTPSTQVPALVKDFRDWMVRNRGVKEPTIARYERLVLRMLPALGDKPASYDASLVRRVLLDEVRNLGCVYAKTFVSALRVFLRFLAADGRCRPGLDRAVPTIPRWSLSALPRYIGASDVERVIA